MQLDSPQFNVARRYAWGLLAGGLVLLLGGAGLILATRDHLWFIPSPPLAIARPLGFFGAALLVAAAGLLPGAVMSFARRALAGRVAFDSEPTVDTPNTRWRRMVWRIGRTIGRVRITAETAAGGLQTFITALLSAGAIAGLVVTWRLVAPPAELPPALQVLAGALVLATFPILVIERFYNAARPELLPEAYYISRLLRLPITAAIFLAATLALRAFGFAWGTRLEIVAGVLIFIVAAEVFVRAAAMLFLPYAPLRDRRATPESRIAGALLRLGRPSWQKFNIAVRSQLGIDLSRSWALAFLQRAAARGLIGLMVFAWATSAFTALSGSQRGIYERFGNPVAVFGPGLHVHLPWPMGMIRTVETGAVHKLPIEFLLSAANTPAATPEAEKAPGAEEPPPPEMNRLWTVGHPNEGSYIIASASKDGQQNFQLVDVDMNVVYRIGASDQAARDAVYNVADPDALIEALASQILVGYFARNTLDSVLLHTREQFAEDFRAALQKDLDGMGSGLEAIAVLMEAVHPPPGAAAAYHSVQAAQILAETQVATSHGDSARTMKSAETASVRERDQAQSLAADIVSQANVDAPFFKADSEAYRRAGFPVIFERWLDQITKAVKRAPTLIIDHRLSKQDTPTVDFRGAGAAPVVPGARE